MREYRIAAIPADGIGKEVIAAGLEVMQAVEARDGGFRLAVETFPWGSDYYRKHGVMMAADGLATLRSFDAIYFGAVGDKEIPDHITLWGLRLPICQGFDQYANLRPTRILPGIKSPLAGRGPADLDWVIIRENSEGEYAGNGGRVHRGLPEEVATETAIFTRVGVERIMRFAFDIARSRPRRHLTVVTKSNAQRHGMVFWDEVAALAGSLGIAPTANLDPSRRFPSMFEPIHGSAFDIAGKGIANPIATFWTGALMLDHLGEKDASARLMRAIERVTASGLATPDLGGRATTREVTQAVCDALRSANS